MRWQLTGYDDNDQLIDQYEIPEDYWPYLELLGIPTPEIYTYDNTGDWPISETAARALARIALDDIGLPMYLDWYVGAVE